SADDVFGEDAFGNVVEALEVAPTGDRQPPLPEQPLESRLAVRPSPPRAGALAGHRQLTGGNRTALDDLAEHRVLEGALLAAHAGPALALVRHPPAHQRIHVERH